MNWSMDSIPMYNRHIRLNQAHDRMLTQRDCRGRYRLQTDPELQKHKYFTPQPREYFKPEPKPKNKKVAIAELVDQIYVPEARVNKIKEPQRWVSAEEWLRNSPWK